MADEFFRRRRIDCDGLPEYIKEKAQSIIEGLEAGTHFKKFGGHTMIFDKTKISIPVSHNYRIMARDFGSGIVIERLVSHEKYNKLLKRR